MVTNCETKGFLRTCGRPGTAVCQYCGRSFCDEHGARLDDGQEICSDKTCQKKKEDLASHFAFKEAVRRRNTEGQCGEKSCSARPRYQCAKCDGLFCESHVTERNFELRDGTPSRGFVCDHCYSRRTLWSRR